MPNKTHRTDYEKYIKDLMLYINDHGIKIKPFPKVHLSNRKQGGVFIKTGYYDPGTKEVYLFVNQRHIKDILRSLAHELIHHHQNLEGRLVGYNGDKVTEDEKLTELEGEAYLKGNLVFRGWTEDQTKSEKPSQTFGKHMKKKIDLNEAKEMNEVDRLFECFCRKYNVQDEYEIKQKTMNRVDEAIQQAIVNVLSESFKSKKLSQAVKDHGGFMNGWTSEWNNLADMTDDEFDEYMQVDPDAFYSDLHRGMYGYNDNNVFQPIHFKDGTYLVRRPNFDDPKSFMHRNKSAENMFAKRGERRDAKMGLGRYRGANPYYDRLVNGTVPERDMMARGDWGFPGEGRAPKPGDNRLNPRAIKQNHILDTYNSDEPDRYKRLKDNELGKYFEDPNSPNSMVNKAKLMSIVKEALDQYLCEAVDSGKWQHSNISMDPFGMGYRITYNKFPFMHPHVAGASDLEKSREYIENATNKLLQYQNEHPEDELDYEKAKQIIGAGRHSELNADPIIMGDYTE